VSDIFISRKACHADKTLRHLRRDIASVHSFNRQEQLMNPVIDVLMKRKSMRTYEEREISAEVKAEILKSTLRAPTAGNMMLYSIVEVTDQKMKDKLAITCDHQPFIARAPMVWLFLADYQRWWDYFIDSDVDELCRKKKIDMRKPEEGDLFLACCDALIAAQNAVIAAESFGLGSCYIGDIMEQYETHKELFNLPQYTFPICMLCFGYPTQQQKDRRQTTRFDQKFIVFENQYRRLGKEDFHEMFRGSENQISKEKEKEGIANPGQAMYLRKFSADFSVEMSRSVRVILKQWTK
jgi:nitroreductase